MYWQSDKTETAGGAPDVHVNFYGEGSRVLVAYPPEKLPPCDQSNGDSKYNFVGVSPVRILYVAMLLLFSLETPTGQG